MKLRTRKKWCSGEASISQEEVHELWKELRGKMEEEVMEQYKVEGLETLALKRSLVECGTLMRGCHSEAQLGEVFGGN